MRLTLRTLLSWKDGMLEAEAARDLAERITASNDARRLLERIEDVMARPTLAAPPADATGFAAAANTAAEYLDNVLPAAQIGDFERVCYASDTQLAETAATHENLAELSRMPPTGLDAAARRRLLAAVNARAAGRDRSDRGSPAVADGDRQSPDVPAIWPADHGRQRAANPASRTPGAPLSAWFLVATALLLLVALVGVLGWSLLKRPAQPSERRQVAARPAAEPVRPEPPAAAADDVEPAPDPVGRAEPPAADPPPPTPDPSAAPEAVVVPAGAVPPAPPIAPAEDAPPFGGDEETEPAREEGVAVVVAVPAAGAAAMNGGDQRVMHGDALAIAAPARVAAEPPFAAPVGPEAAAAAGDAAPRVVGTDIVLHRSAGDQDEEWQAGAQGELDLPVDLVAPPFCRPAVAVEGLQITLEPGTCAVLRRDAAGVPRLDVVFGEASTAGQGRLGLTAGALTGVVTVAPAAPVIVRVNLERPRGASSDSTQRVARILCGAGPLAWRQTAADGEARESPFPGIPAEVIVPAGQALVWRSVAPDAATVEAAGQPTAGPADRGTRDAIVRRAAEALTRRCGAGTPALPALRDLAADRRSESRLAAAAALAMVGEFDQLAALLLPGPAPDGKDDAWVGHWAWLWSLLDETTVQCALTRGPRSVEKLSRALEARAREVGAEAETAETILQLARGYSDDALAQGGAAAIVAALASPDLTVRRYAIDNLVQITGTDGGYRADGSDDARRKAMKWWQARLEQGGIRRDAAPDGAGR